jgi:hypothetical protein
MKTTKNTIRARLSVYGMSGLTNRQLKALKKWVEMLAKEMGELEPRAYTKNPRFTLYK